MLVIATGGTIAQNGSRLATLRVEDLLALLPALGGIANVTAEQALQVSSADITPRDWLTLAHTADAALRREDVHGVVITHGTDTLEETAYFLHLVLRHAKPVVIVGSMRGSHAVSADGPANLFNAVLVAASEVAHGNGVLVVMNDRIHSAREVTKLHTHALDAFQSPGSGELGVVQSGKIRCFREQRRWDASNSAFDIDAISAVPKVEIAYGYAGVDLLAIDAIRHANVHGLVFAGTGNGSVPASVLPALKEAADSNVLVVRSSRVNGGSVERNEEHNDDELHFVTAGSLNPQKARVLLMLALTQTNDPARVQAMFDKY